MRLIENKMIGGILLVSGTTIGAGMLALPTVTGLAGFFPSILLFIAYWAFFVFTAFLMLEASLWMGNGTNLISMAKKTLGTFGEIITWITFLFLLYALTTAYLSGSSSIVLEFFSRVFGYELPIWLGPLPLLLTFGIFVYRGAKFVDAANRILMFGLAIAYCLTIYFLVPHIEMTLISHVDWSYIALGNSIIATSFGFHIIIPSLATYMDRDLKKLRKVIFIGSLIPLLIYILWEFSTLGVIPIEGVDSITTGYKNGDEVTSILTAVLGNTFLSMIIRIFSFFAIITSFLGVSLSLRDFLADGFNIQKTGSGKFKLYLMTFLPALLIIWTYPNIFIMALEFAGAFGVMILLGFLPALIVWKGRYKKKIPSTYEVIGGKLALIIIMSLSICAVLLEIINKLGYFHRSLRLEVKVFFP